MCNRRKPVFYLILDDLDWFVIIKLMKLIFSTMNTTTTRKQAGEF